jgi:hypothetical protein
MQTYAKFMIKFRFDSILNINYMKFKIRGKKFFGENSNFFLCFTFSVLI